MAGFPLPHDFFFRQHERKSVNLIPQVSARRDFREQFMRSFDARGLRPRLLRMTVGEGAVRRKCRFAEGKDKDTAKQGVDKW